MKRKRHVEIAGAGFAGLVAGAALAQRGWSVRIHERDVKCRSFGAGIWFWENGVRVLEAIGAADQALDGAIVIPRWHSHDETGAVIDELEFGTHEKGGRLFCIVRQKLYDSVLDAALRAGVEIVTSSKVVGATPAGELLLESGASFKADLVIGADGVHSKVRDSLGLLSHRRPSGDGAIRLNVHRTPEEADDPAWSELIEWWKGNRRLLYTPCSRDTVYLCLTSVVEDTAALSTPVPKEEWKRTFPHVAHLLDRMPESGRWDPFETVYVHAWSKGLSAIIGDAAHAMVPGLGQGCGSSVMNAYSLAATLEEHDTVEEALQAWEAREKPLTDHIQFWSWTTWPLTTIPPGIARQVFNFPGFSQWLTEQRAKPSLHIPHGTERRPRWMPPEYRHKLSA